MVIGIDPGFSGAIAFLSSDKLVVRDLPLTKIKGRKQIDGGEFAGLIHGCEVRMDECILFAALEDVHSMPHDGVVSAFRFGYNAGILLGVLKALGIKVLRLDPGVWKAQMGVTSDKKTSLARARKLFPLNKKDFARAKDDGRAEAALMAHLVKGLWE